MSGEEPGKDGGKRPPGSPWLFVGASLQLGAAVVLGTLLGWWLDGRWGIAPWGAVAGGILGTILGMYYVLRSST